MEIAYATKENGRSFVDLDSENLAGRRETIEA